MNYANVSVTAEQNPIVLNRRQTREAEAPSVPYSPIDMIPYSGPRMKDRYIELRRNLSKTQMKEEKTESS